VKTFRYFLLTSLLAFSLQLANAQSELNVAVGFGTAQASASGGGIQGNPNSFNFFGACTPGSSATCSPSKELSGLMMGFRGNVLLTKHFGIGADVSFQPGKQDYATFPSSAIQAGGANLQSRTTFYDVDAVVQPLKGRRAALELLAGIGGANLKFYATGSSNDAVLGTQNFSQLYGSSNHFQVHTGAGVNIFLTKNVFVRPQFDLHYVTNLNQFGRNAVTQESIWVGYRWGGE
jgi:Outer membrane protein beta-barrel domain